jgi:hypothetical protein
MFGRRPQWLDDLPSAAWCTSVCIGRIFKVGLLLESFVREFVAFVR